MVKHRICRYDDTIGVDYVRDFVALQQRTHLTALKLYHQEVFRKSREIERKFEKLKSSVKGEISDYNINVHRIGNFKPSGNNTLLFYDSEIRSDFHVDVIYWQLRD
ncbi:hypothetical protein BBBOND_0102470 [Babesia bigemina]|uniref:Uncharacterized protein n=1 Tax=Babesia bigemina TaxID=5866 RepID=A0A061CZS8_BABBI|nr:hypothetical protein BBBOND_0102470 [Babesia bigemina]CDR93918.1 hypothetical protein BBBOND_0102470 [Babesia bigemina]|eukprot:XP_012766104.1 hypothetical protein BBBOND_0102470 [Babesia bigemina]